MKKSLSNYYISIRNSDELRVVVFDGQTIVKTFAIPTKVTTFKIRRGRRK